MIKIENNIPNNLHKPINMVLLSSNRNRIIFILLISAITFLGWMLGAEKVYTRVLLSATNGSLNVINKGAHIELEEITGMKEHYQFKVNAVIGGRTGNYPQKIGGMLQPFVIILTWQIFLFFILTPQTALRAFLINVGLFILIQIFFLILLTNYYSSDSARYIYTMLLDSFYIVALILIIKDNIMYNIFTKKSENSYK